MRLSPRKDSVDGVCVGHFSLDLQTKCRTRERHREPSCPVTPVQMLEYNSKTFTFIRTHSFPCSTGFGFGSAEREANSAQRRWFWFWFGCIMSGERTSVAQIPFKLNQKGCPSFCQRNPGKPAQIGRQNSIKTDVRSDLGCSLIFFPRECPAVVFLARTRFS